jgi:hypothetical protein
MTTLSTAVSTGTSSYTHFVCPECGAPLYCSEAEEWMTNLIDVSGATEQVDDVPTGFGFCPHLDDDDGIPVVVFTSPPGETAWHRCGGG